jgi:hypothetical protein
MGKKFDTWRRWRRTGALWREIYSRTVGAIIAGTMLATSACSSVPWTSPAEPHRTDCPGQLRPVRTHHHRGRDDQRRAPVHQPQVLASRGREAGTQDRPAPRRVRARDAGPQGRAFTTPRGAVPASLTYTLSSSPARSRRLPCSARPCAHGGRRCWRTSTPTAAATAARKTSREGQSARSRLVQGSAPQFAWRLPEAGSPSAGAWANHGRDVRRLATWGRLRATAGAHRSGVSQPELDGGTSSGFLVPLPSPAAASCAAHLRV